MPVATNCSCVLFAMLGVAGVTPMVASTAAVTVNVLVLDMVPEVAVIVVEPAPTAVAKPPALIDATVGVEDVHITEVSACFVPSL